MKRTITLWTMLSLLLTGWPGVGQETDSLFFQPDSLQSIPASPDKATRPGVVQQRLPAESFMKGRVNFTSDFIRRLYNPPSGTDQPACDNRIRSLFDNEDSRLAHRLPTGPTAYADAVDQFVGDICGRGESQLLTDPNEQLYADVRGRVSWQQQEHPLTLYLKKQRSGLNWSWEIIGVETDFRLPAADRAYQTIDVRDSPVFIPPNAHELNFMGLAKQLRASGNLGQFVSAAAATDTQLRAVAQQMAAGQLRLLTLQTTILWLNTQRGWLLQLRQFNRETDNSGWLISDLCRADEVARLPLLLRPFITTH